MHNSSAPHHQHEVKGLKSCQKAVSVCTLMADADVAVIVVYKDGPGETHHEHLVFCGPGK